MTDAAQHFGGLDSLVLNSAYGAKGFIRQSPLQEWRQAFEVNLIGMIPTLQAAFPYLDKSKRGARIILVSSVGSVRAGGGLGAYCATKAAVNSLTRYEKQLVVPGIIISSYARTLAVEEPNSTSIAVHVSE